MRTLCLSESTNDLIVASYSAMPDIEQAGTVFQKLLVALTLDCLNCIASVPDVGDCDGGSLLSLLSVLIVKFSVRCEAIRDRDIACDYSEQGGNIAKDVCVLRERLDVDHISKFPGELEERKDRDGGR